jgi:hypothetical protein
MSQIQISIPSDGSVATYVKGSYHIHHAGVTYLNLLKKSSEIAIFPESTTAEIVNGKMHVVGFGEKTHIFKPAEKVDIQVSNMAAPCNVATYVAGSFELHLNDETYFIKDSAPYYRIPEDISASLHGETVHCVYLLGRRCIRNVVFEKVETEKIASKRKEMESAAEVDYIKDEKRAKTRHSDAGKASKRKEMESEAEVDCIEDEKRAKTRHSDAGKDGDK